MLAVGDGWYYHEGRNAARALGAICIGLVQLPAEQQTLATVSVLPLLAYFAEEHDTHVQVYTFDALARLSVGGIEPIRNLAAARPPAGLITQRQRDHAGHSGTTDSHPMLDFQPPDPTATGIIPRCVELLKMAQTKTVQLRALVIIANVCTANSYISTVEDVHIDSILTGGAYQVDALTELLKLMQSPESKTRRLVLQVISNVLAGNASQVARVLSLDCTSGSITCGRFVPLLFKVMAGVPTCPKSTDPANPIGNKADVTLGEREEAARSIANATHAGSYQVEKLVDEVSWTPSELSGKIKSLSTSELWRMHRLFSESFLRGVLTTLRARISVSSPP